MSKFIAHAPLSDAKAPSRVRTAQRPPAQGESKCVASESDPEGMKAFERISQKVSELTVDDIYAAMFGAK
jgi:hypothetical protein